MLLVLELILVDDSTFVGYKLKIKTRKQSMSMDIDLILGASHLLDIKFKI